MLFSIANNLAGDVESSGSPVAVVICGASLTHLCLQTVTLKILLWQGMRADLTNQRLERPQASFLVGVEHCIIGQKFTVHKFFT